MSIILAETILIDVSFWLRVVLIAYLIGKGISFLMKHEFKPR